MGDVDSAEKMVGMVTMNAKNRPRIETIGPRKCAKDSFFEISKLRSRQSVGYRHSVLVESRNALSANGKYHNCFIGLAQYCILILDAFGLVFKEMPCHFM